MKSVSRGGAEKEGRRGEERGCRIGSGMTIFLLSTSPSLVTPGLIRGPSFLSGRQSSALVIATGIVAPMTKEKSLFDSPKAEARSEARAEADVRAGRLISRFDAGFRPGGTRTACHDRALISIVSPKLSRGAARAEADVREGRLISHEAVRRWLSSWGSAKPLPRPRVN